MQNYKGQQIVKQIGTRLSKLIAKADKFGKQVNIQIQKDDVHHTICGSIVSILILSFVFYTFIDLFLSMIDGQAPNVISNIEFTKDPEVNKYQKNSYLKQLVTLNKDNFAIVIAVTDDKSQPIFQLENYTYFIPYAYICNRQAIKISGIVSDYQTECKSFQMKRCSSVQKNEKLWNQMGLSENHEQIGYCLDDDAWEYGLKLEGFTQSDSFKFVNFYIQNCYNVTNSQISSKKNFFIIFLVCAPQEDINKKLNSGYVGFIVSDRLINQKQKGNPFNIFGKTLSTPFSITQFQYMEVYFRHSYIQTFENFYYYFFENTYDQHELQFERITQQTIYTSRPNLVSLTILLDDKKISQYRTYDNVLNILGNIGGLLEVLFVVAGIIIEPLSDISLKIYLSNSIFAFEDNESDLKNQSKIQQDRDHFEADEKSKIPIFRKIVTSNINSLRDKESNNSMMYLKKFFRQKLKGLKLQFVDYAQIIFGGKKRELINKGVEKIFDKIDILNLMRKMIEIDKLKMLLLTPEQLKLFDYIPRPKIVQQTTEFKRNESLIQLQQINNEQYGEISYFFLEKKDFITSVKEAYQAYIVIKGDMNDKLNKKLVNFIEKDLKLLFDEQFNFEHQIQEKNRMTVNAESVLRIVENQQENDLDMMIRQVIN